MKLPLPSQSIVSITVVVLFSFNSCSQKGDGGKVHIEPDAENAAVTISIPQFNNTDQFVKAQLADFLKGYFALNQALIEDSLAGAKVAALELTGTTKKLEISKLTGEQMDFYLVQSSKLKASLLEISSSSDIEQARIGLATVSEAMYALVKAFHPNESTLYYQYCPMARNNQGANWLSTTEELVNPYMGQIMLQCGRTQEKLE